MCESSDKVIRYVLLPHELLKVCLPTQCILNVHTDHTAPPTSYYTYADYNPLINMTKNKQIPKKAQFQLVLKLFRRRWANTVCYDYTEDWAGLVPMQ